jgi:hypothetical protein
MYISQGKCLDVDASIIKKGESLGVKIGVVYRQYLRRKYTNGM